MSPDHSQKSNKSKVDRLLCEWKGTSVPKELKGLCYHCCLTTFLSSQSYKHDKNRKRTTHGHLEMSKTGNARLKS